MYRSWLHSLYGLHGHYIPQSKMAFKLNHSLTQTHFCNWKYLYLIQIWVLFDPVVKESALIGVMAWILCHYLIQFWPRCWVSFGITRALSQHKYCLSRYGDFYYKDNTVMRQSYPYYGNFYTVKMTSLYWDGPPGHNGLSKLSKARHLWPVSIALKVWKFVMYYVSCQKGPTRHAYAWQIGPFWQDTLDIFPVTQMLYIIY